MDPSQTRELTSRLVSGESLTPDEEQSLLAWLRAQPEVRDAYLANESLHALLGNLGRLRATKEAFVAATLRRVISHPMPSPGASPERDSAGESYAPSPTIPASVVLKALSNNGRSARQRWNWQLAAGACAMLLLMAAMGGLLAMRHNFAPLAKHQASPRQDAPDRATPGGGENARNVFARLDSLHDAQWDAPHVAGERLAAGRLSLLQGAAVVRFDKGTVAQVTGPAVIDLRSPDELFLARGSLAARVPPQATGFTVTTPVGRVVDLGTEFDVCVNDAGSTETRVRLGRVSFRPQRAGELPGKPIELTAQGLDRAIAAVPDISAPVLPVCTQVRGKQGTFAGTICANGKTMEFTSQEAFDKAHARVLKQLREAPRHFSEQWSIMTIETSASGAASASAGVSVGSDRAPQFPGGASLPDARQMLREQLQQQQKASEGNPQMQQLLDKALRDLDQDK